MKRNIFLGQRLKQARIKAKLSMDELCYKIDGVVTKQAISKYEKGVMCPSSDILIRISEVLNQDIDFFFRPITLEDKSLTISFRKQESIKVKDLNALKVEIQDDIERFLEIDEILGNTDRKFRMIKPNINSISNISDMVKCAQQIRMEWHLGITPINNIQFLLEENGINVIFFNGIQKLDGVSAMVEDKPFMVLNSNIDMIERQRFTAMHELGHILFNNYMVSELSKKDKENLCNAFANEILLPSIVIEKHFSTMWKNLPLKEMVYIQKMYGISIDAIMYKLKSLRIVSETIYKKFYTKKNKNHDFKVKIEKSRFNEERVSRLETKVYNALDQDLITQSKAAFLLKQPIENIYSNINTI